jgi:NAD(P)-dependent dehydrogenase (short-subunit alcohol dehydrogenase family)
MKTRVDGHVAIVTGAARGIGLGIAKVLQSRGAKVIVWDRDIAPLKDVKDFTAASAVALDISDYASVEKAFNAAVAEFGQIHIVGLPARRLGSRRRHRHDGSFLYLAAGGEAHA